MSGRRAFIKGVVSLSVASAFWNGYARAEVSNLVNEFKGLGDKLGTIFAVDSGYLNDIVPQIVVQLNEQERGHLKALMQASNVNSAYGNSEQATKLVVQKIMKGIYTGKYINHFDARYDFFGGYSRKLLPEVYKPRIMCSGETNYWASI